MSDTRQRIEAKLQDMGVDELISLYAANEELLHDMTMIPLFPDFMNRKPPPPELLDEIRTGSIQIRTELEARGWVLVDDDWERDA